MPRNKRNWLWIIGFCTLFYISLIPGIKATVEISYLTPGDYYINLKNDYIRAWVVVDIDSLQAFKSTYWNNLFLKIIVRNEVDSKKQLDFKDIKIIVRTKEGKSYTNINYTDLDVKTIVEPVLYVDQKGAFLAQYALNIETDKIPFSKEDIESVQIVFGETTIPMKGYTRTSPLRLQKLVDLETYLIDRIKDLEQKEKDFKKSTDRLNGKIKMLQDEIRGLKSRIKNLEGNILKVKLKQAGNRTVKQLIDDYNYASSELKKTRGRLASLQNDYDNLSKSKEDEARDYENKIAGIKKESDLKIATLEGKINNLKKELKSKYGMSIVLIACVVGLVFGLVIAMAVKKKSKKSPAITTTTSTPPA